MTIFLQYLEAYYKLYATFKFLNRNVKMKEVQNHTFQAQAKENHSARNKLSEFLLLRLRSHFSSAGKPYFSLASFVASFKKFLPSITPPLKILDPLVRNHMYKRTDRMTICGFVC